MARRTRNEETRLTPALPANPQTDELAGTYTVLARRYRPQQFADLVGQEALVQALTNALRSNRVAHAYLFTGARGVGKTSTARILAKCLNCVNGPTVTPCDQCESCRAIAVGEDVDVIEIDGASNNRVEEIRELRSNAQYRPTRSRYKIYIIDEVHMLTTSAFNALLKTLEEPPPHVKFIFATTEVHKVPLTILSRCQRFDFASIRTEDILKQLQQIANREGIVAEEEALRLIARRASGSLRDAESLLDQALAFGDGRLTLAQVEQLLGLAGEEQILALAEAILSRDPARAWQILDEALRRGVQPGELLDQLLEYWRDLLLLQTVGPSCESFSFADRHLDRLQGWAQTIPLDHILTAMDLIAGTKSRLRGSSQPRVLVEMLLVRLTRLESLVAISELAERLTSSTAGAEQSKAANRNPAALGSASTRPGGSPRPFVSNPASPRAGASPGSASAGSTRVSSSGRPTASSATPGQVPRDESPQAARSPFEPSGGPQTLSAGTASGTPQADLEGPIEFSEAALPRIRQALLNALGDLLRMDLEPAALAICAPNCLALRFPVQYNAVRTRCERRRSDLEEALRRILGRDIQLRFETITGSVASPPEVAPTGRPPDRLQRLEQIPLIREAMVQLGARLLPERVDPGFGQEEILDRAESQREPSR